MTLQDFEKQIDSVILKRGKEYFNNNSVEFLEEINKGYNLVFVQSYNYPITLWEHRCFLPQHFNVLVKKSMAKYWKPQQLIN